MKLNEALGRHHKIMNVTPGAGDRGEQYQHLSDASIHVPELDKGQIEIWYVKGNFTRDFGMGYKFVSERGLLPTNIAELNRSHVLLGRVRGFGLNDSGLEHLYMAMQGEVWSPTGEAYNFISKSGTMHTSMSMGDIVKHGSDLWMVDYHGFQHFSFE